MVELPWGDAQVLNDNEFYDRTDEFEDITALLESASRNNAPNLFLTGIRGVGKTVFLKKIKNHFLNEDYLVVYMDFSRSSCFLENQTSVIGLIEYYYNTFMRECSKNNINLLTKKVKKFFKTNNFLIKDVANIDKIPIPVFTAQKDIEKLKDFVFELPQHIYEENEDKIKGVIVIIDEFQVINELGKYKNGFLWNFRSYIQNHRNVSYVLSGSMGLQDKLIYEISSKEGVFGGRLLSFQLEPFTKQITKHYLNERVPELKFSEKGFEQFYKCTSGIPSYINIFANLLPKNEELNEIIIKEKLEKSISLISINLIQIWDRLRLKEQKIIVTLLERPLKRITIANILETSSGSLSIYLNNLQNLGLIQLNNDLYTISEPLLARWLKTEYNKKGVYPFRIS